MTIGKDIKSEAPKKTTDELKAELRLKIRLEIERLDGLYDAEMLKCIDFERRIEQAKGVDDATDSMVRELAIVQKTRRDIGDLA